MHVLGSISIMYTNVRMLHAKISEYCIMYIMKQDREHLRIFQIPNRATAHYILYQMEIVYFLISSFPCCSISIETENTPTAAAVSAVTAAENASIGFPWQPPNTHRSSTSINSMWYYVYVSYIKYRYVICMRFLLRLYIQAMSLIQQIGLPQMRVRT